MIVTIATTAAWVAGCGDEEAGGEDGRAVTTSSLSKAEYVKQANKTCVDVDRETLEETRKKAGDDASYKQIIKATEITLAPKVESQIERLRALGAPAGDEDRIEAWLVAIQKGLDEYEDEESTAYATFIKIKNIEKADEMADEYGLAYCILRN